MIRVTMLRKICTVLFTLSLAAGFLLPVHAATVENTITNAKANNTTLIEQFFTGHAKDNELGILGSYFDTGIDAQDDPAWPISGSATTDVYAAENALALMAFTARKQVQNDGTMNDWAKDIAIDIFGASGALAQNGVPSGYAYSENQLDTGANPDFTEYRFAIAQFMSMEALGKYATTFQDDSIISRLDEIYNGVYFTYLCNSSYTLNFPAEPKGQMATWFSCVRKGGEHGYVSIDDPLNHDWSYPLTNVSLWAAIGFARMGLASRGTTADEENFFTKGSEVQSFGDNCTAVAEASMLYPEIWCYNPTYGLYAEHWEDDTDVFQLSTQALAILACSRLYQATQKQFYLERADSLLASIAKYFFVGALSAGVSSVDFKTIPGTANRSTLIDGYSNAMLAMGLGDLFQVTGNYEYARLCTDIVAFFNTYMMDNTKEVKGYDEFLDATTFQLTGYGDYSEKTTKFIATNSMLLFANEMVIEANKSFWDLYALWIIIGAIVAAGVIVVVILVRRRGAVGTKLSKTVRGLITEA